MGNEDFLNRKDVRKYLANHVMILKEPPPKEEGTIIGRPFERDDALGLLSGIMLAYPREVLGLFESFGMNRKQLALLKKGISI